MPGRGTAGRLIWPLSLPMHGTWSATDNNFPLEGSELTTSLLVSCPSQFLATFEVDLLPGHHDKVALRTSAVLCDRWHPRVRHTSWKAQRAEGQYQVAGSRLHHVWNRRFVRGPARQSGGDQLRHQHFCWKVLPPSGRSLGWSSAQLTLDYSTLLRKTATEAMLCCLDPRASDLRGKVTTTRRASGWHRSPLALPHGRPRHTTVATADQ